MRGDFIQRGILKTIVVVTLASFAGVAAHGDVDPPLPACPSGNTDIHNRCEQFHTDAESNDTNAHYERIAGGVYGIAAAICTSECFFFVSGNKACVGAGFAGMAADLLDAIKVGGKSEAILGGVQGAMGTVFSVTQAGKNEGWRGQDDAIGNKAACMMAGMNAIQATMRFIQANNADGNVENDRRELQKLLNGNQSQITAPSISNPNGTGGNGTQPNETPLALNQNSPHTDKAGTPGDKLAADAVQAGFGDALKTFSDKTGKSPGELFDRILNGQNPVVAATEMAATKDGPQLADAGKKLADFANQVQDQLKDELAASAAKSKFNATYASTSTNRAVASHEPEMDIAGMMAAMMPKKPGQEQGSNGPKPLGFAATTAKLSNEGFHPPSRSIFDVVDSRYALVTRRLLESGAVVSPSQPPTMVPTNPYLRK